MIARGEDGVPWELYENGYLLFKPEDGKDTLVNRNGDSTWKREHGEKIKHVGFSGKVYAPSDSSRLFSMYGRYDNDTDFKFNPTTFDTTNFDTSKVVNMYRMFYNLNNLTTLNATHFNTSNVTNMSGMFQGMGKLNTLDVTHFETNNVTAMDHMFDGLASLTDLDVTHFDTSKVTNMEGMFQIMPSLVHLDVTHFDTSNVTNMWGMFAHLRKLTNLDVTHFDTSKVTNMTGMFSQMSNLTSLDVTYFDTNNVTAMGRMFKGLERLTNLDVTHFDTSKVTDMTDMFSQMSNLMHLDVTNFDTSRVKNMRHMFFAMTKLKELKIGDKFNADGINTIFTTHDYGNQYTDKWHKLNDKEHSYTVSDWANLYRSNPATTAGTWVRESNVQDSTLTFNGETLPPVKVASNAPILPELPRPTQPKPNSKFKGWSKIPNGPLLTRDEVKPGENITLHPIWEDVDSAETRTAKIAVTKIYKADNTLDYGKQTETPGAEGEKTITTTYTVTPYSGELTNPVESEVITMLMKPTVVNVGTKPTDKVETIPSPRRYEKDPEREKGAEDIVVQGKDGKKVTTTTYKVNEQTGEITETVGEPVVTEPTETVVKVAAKDKVVTEEIESPKRYVGDEEQDYGSESKETPGTKGSRTTTTVYTVNPKTGDVTEETTTVTKDPTETVVKVGTKPTVVKTKDNEGRTVITKTTYTVDPKTGKVTPTVTVMYENNKDPKVVTETIPSPRRYEKDPEREKGAEDIVVQGKDGKKVTTTTYKVNEQTGEITETVGEPVVTEPTETVVKVAAKDKVVTEEIEPSVVYERDDMRDFGTPNEEIKGELGKKVTTTEYSVNEKTGDVTETVKDSVVTPAGTTRIKVGTKKRVEMIRKGGNVIEKTTEYELDSKTGKVTEKVTEKLVSSNGNEQPPILDISEYNGVLSGNGLDGDGNQIQPPVTDVPEYTDPISMNGEPEVHEKPDYKIPKEQPKPEQPKKDLPPVPQKQLPNTGDASMFVSATGIVMMGIGALARPKRKK